MSQPLFEKFDWEKVGDHSMKPKVNLHSLTSPVRHKSRIDPETLTSGKKYECIKGFDFYNEKFFNL